MRDLPAIVALYAEIDARLDADRQAAEDADDSARAEQVRAKQVIHDQAYFVLCWGQLEAAIDDKCRTAIRRHQAQREWIHRRAWDLYNPDDRRISGLSFEDKTALVVDRGGGHGSPWAKVMNYYQLRNQIAHGDLRRTRIEVSEVARDFYIIAAALRD
jgi:hypothetical protein